MGVDTIHRIGATPDLRFTWVQEDGTTALDLTGKTLTITARRPDGTDAGPWTPSVVGAATDGIADYTVLTGDWNMEGNWHFQGKAVGGGRTWISDEHHREIKAAL